VGVDDSARRLAYAVVDSRLGFTHHNGSVQIFPAALQGPDGGAIAGSRFVWIADLLPASVAVYVAELMDRGLVAAKQGLEARSRVAAG
jgi:hypothetical protein